MTARTERGEFQRPAHNGPAWTRKLHRPGTGFIGRPMKPERRPGTGQAPARTWLRYQFPGLLAGSGWASSRMT